MPGLSSTVVPQTLEWALAIVAEGNPLPPIGFVADLGCIAVGIDRESQGGPKRPLPASLSGLMLSYEDHVLGKVIADRSFDRAADVVRRLRGREQARALAFVMEQFRMRAGFVGMHISPGVIKSLNDFGSDKLLAQTWKTIEETGLDSILLALMEDLIAKTRLSPDMLGQDDVFELEHGTALAEFGQRVALRQLLRSVQLISEGLPSTPPRGVTRRREVPTRITDEDVYPVGGFASISNRGGIESMLHSQLALMEPATGDRPDLFDIKFVRDELLYYSRDENQFLRRRRGFAIVLDKSLASARFKDIEAPYQRIILGLAGIVVLIRTTRKWLDCDKLTFDITLSPELADELILLQTVFREEIALAAIRLHMHKSSDTKSTLMSTLPPDTRKLFVTASSQSPPGWDRLEFNATLPRLVINDESTDVATAEVVPTWTATVGAFLLHWMQESK